MGGPHLTSEWDGNLWEIRDGNQEMEIYQPSTSSLRNLEEIREGNLWDGNLSAPHIFFEVFLISLVSEN